MSPERKPLLSISSGYCASNLILSSFWPPRSQSASLAQSSETSSDTHVDSECAHTQAGSETSSNTLVDSKDFSEGGYGWICVFVSFVFHFFAIGIECTWGVYQRHFFDEQIFIHAENSQLAWVGSIQAAAPSVSGLLAGHLAKHIGFARTSIIGIVLMATGLISASFSTKVWHLYLTQGLLFGFGSGLAFIMALTIVPQWFQKHRGFATGIGVSGSGIGGLILNPVTQFLIDHLGFRWSLRIIGIITFISLITASAFLKTPSSGHSTNIKNSSDKKRYPFKDHLFWLLCAVGFWSGFGFYTPIFYVPDYATNNLRLTPTNGATSTAIISGLSALGRILMGIFGDYFGHLNALIICQGMGGLAQMALWPAARTFIELLSFCGFYGFFSGGFVSLYPVVAADLFGANRAAIITGILFFAYLPGTLISPPIYGAIIDKDSRPGEKLNFLPMQLLSGIAMLFAALSALIVQCIRLKSSLENFRANSNYSNRE